ncbi:CBO0543 family protein [Bacillus sp. UNC41MFS5]|uniref:CBO0543 family protein n=1 Tax=Bacillus sp. UNC41MFS5 TaxID=1449046 RepID=UPI001E6306E9|nr:CBO0543 family protein [Bacillus sp. UNC41MFS5]
MEYMILAAMWLFGFIGFILFIPIKDRRKGLLAAIMFQAFIWLCDMPAFTYGLLSAPVRLFPKATDITVTINYIFYPILFAIFYVHRKAKNSPWFRFTYFFGWISILTIYDTVLERYTDLIKYESLTWYGMWIYIGFLFFISLVCCNWFYKEKPPIKSHVGGTNED